MINKTQFYNFVHDYILPLFPGTKISSSDDPIPRRNRSNLITQCVRRSASDQKIMPNTSATYCITIHRSQIFTKEELKLIRSFLQIASERNIYDKVEEIYFKDLVNSALTEAITGSLTNKTDLAYKIISNMMLWAQQTYEGQNISMSVGIIPEASTEQDQSVPFEQVIGEDFLKVLSNGYDTILQINCRSHDII